MNMIFKMMNAANFKRSTRATGAVKYHAQRAAKSRGGFDAWTVTESATNDATNNTADNDRAADNTAHNAADTHAQFVSASRNMDVWVTVFVYALNERRFIDARNARVHALRFARQMARIQQPLDESHRVTHHDVRGREVVAQQERPVGQGVFQRP